MSARTRKIAFWAVGMGLVGLFFGSLESYYAYLPAVMLDKPLYPLVGTLLGAGVGYLFSRRLPPNSK
jgi:hypothetical protein